MNNIPHEIDSIALFGSVARRDQDSLSDRDILLVSDDASCLITSGQMLKRNHWANANYSWQQLNSFAKHGGLFLQHLKQEAIIIKDKDNRLTQFLSEFTPRPDYTNEIDEAIDFLGLLSAMPDSESGKLWALDVLMVGFRCLAIATLANRAVYHFSLSDILTTLKTMGFITSSERDNLMLLRKYKRAYRSGYFDQAPKWDAVYSSITAVDHGFKLGLDIQKYQPPIVIERVLADNHHRNQNWYFESRKLESALISLSVDKNQLETQNNRQDLLNKIKAPSENSHYFKYDYNEIRNRLVILCKESKDKILV